MKWTQMRFPIFGLGSIQLIHMCCANAPFVPIYYRDRFIRKQQFFIFFNAYTFFHL